jgi:hypothetical protein
MTVFLTDGRGAISGRLANLHTSPTAGSQLKAMVTNTGTGVSMPVMRDHHGELPLLPVNGNPHSIGPYRKAPPAIDPRG